MFNIIFVNSKNRLLFMKQCFLSQNQMVLRDSEWLKAAGLFKYV